MNKQEEIRNYKVGQKVAIYGYIDAIDIENISDIENTTTLRIKTPVKTISINPKYEEVVTDFNKSKPVVPQFVADWIEWCKKNNITLLGACTAICDNKNIRSLDASGWATKNQETFAKAWFYGYEVDKEKLYTVEIPRSGKPDHSVLRKYVDGKVCIDRHIFDNWRDYKCFQLTEAEIKKEHGWTWKYAEEVKE